MTDDRGRFSGLSEIREISRFFAQTLLVFLDLAKKQRNFTLVDQKLPTVLVFLYFFHSREKARNSTLVQQETSNRTCFS